MATKKKKSAYIAIPVSMPSYADQIMSLEPGESASRAHRIDGDAASKAAITLAMDKLANGYSASIKRAKERTECDYKLEVLVSRTRSHDVICVAVVTRADA